MSEQSPCHGCGGTGDFWERAKKDWGSGRCPHCNGTGVNLTEKSAIQEKEMTYLSGQRVTFRESEAGPAETGVVIEELPPTDAHPHGGEYDLLLDDGTGVIAWVAEIEPA